MYYDEIWFNLEWTEEDLINELEATRQRIQNEMWESHITELMEIAGA